MFEQAKIAAQDPEHFELVKDILNQAFAIGNVGGYLERLKKANVRVRNFEGALQKGLLGKEMAAAYQALPTADQGQIRELYLSMIERVAPELRAKYLKLYAYY